MYKKLLTYKTYIDWIELKQIYWILLIQIVQKTVKNMQVTWL